MSCGISSSFPEVFPTSGQVTHVLLTRPPLDWKELPPSASLDLHVLSTPPAFILSQDQTLHLKVFARLELALSPIDASQTLYVSENSGFSKKPGKRRLARSTQFSRNRAPGPFEPESRAVPPARHPKIRRLAADLSAYSPSLRPVKRPSGWRAPSTCDGSRTEGPFGKNLPLRGKGI